MSEKKKPMHPWRAWNPGALKSSKEREQKIMPSHARPIK